MSKADIITLNKADKKQVFPALFKGKSAGRNTSDEKDACSACVGSLVRALYRLDDKQKLHVRRKYVSGRGLKDEAANLGVGSCTGGFEKCVKGCPPNTLDILHFLKNL